MLVRIRHGGKIEILTVIAILAVLIGIAVPAVMAIRKSAMASTTTTKQTSSAASLHPPTGQPPLTQDPGEKLWYDSPMVLALVAGAIAALGWLYKQVIDMITIRVELGIVEVLSDSNAMTRSSLQSAVRKRFSEARVPDVFSDALAKLYAKDRLHVRGGKYSLKQSSPPGAPSAAGGPPAP